MKERLQQHAFVLQHPLMAKIGSYNIEYHSKCALVADQTGPCVCVGPPVITCGSTMSLEQGGAVCSVQCMHPLRRRGEQKLINFHS